MRVVNHTRESVLGSEIRMASDLFGRLRGFLLRPEPHHGEGILLSPCKAVHMFGIRYPLDVLFVDQKGEVVAIHPMLRPGERTPVYSRATYALELPAGSIDASGTMVGDRLAWAPALMENGGGGDA